MIQRPSSDIFDIRYVVLLFPRSKDDACTQDSIFARISDGRRLKWLSIVDEYTRECLASEARRGTTAEDIRIILAEVAARRGGPPCRMQSDNEPEFVAEVVRSWLEETGFGAPYIAPGGPRQNGSAESFHSKVRDEFLNREEFESEPQARALGALWKEEYNTERPHSSLGYKTPAEFWPLARGVRLSMKTCPIPRLLN